MTDWYRRSDWNEEIAADFEARLARARPSSRAQYLSLQGYALLARHPEQAETLLDRVVETGEAAELPRAACYLALSRVAQGKIDSAIDAYQLAIEAERREPAFRSSAAADQALLIALHERHDLFSQALDQLAMAVDDGWSLAGFEALAADAIIRQARGEAAKARAGAREALEQFPEYATDSQWAGISFNDLRTRLELIAQ